MKPDSVLTNPIGKDESDVKLVGVYLIYIYPIRYFFIVTTSQEGWPAKAKETPVAVIMAAFIHVKYVDNISYHDLSS